MQGHKKGSFRRMRDCYDKHSITGNYPVTNNFVLQSISF